MDRPPVATTEGQQIHETNTPTESRDLAATQGASDVALTLFDWLWDDRPGWVCLATDHRIRDIKSKRKSSDFRNTAWFSWPEGRSKIWARAEMVMNSREVWFTPALLQTQDRKATNATDNGRICQVDADHTDEWTEEETATRSALLVKLNAAVVKSGTNGNFHAYIKLDRDTPRDVIDGLNAQLTTAFAGDSTKENASSVLRMPGTFNHKTDPSNPVDLERLPESFPGWDPAELASLLPEAQKTPTEARDGAIMRREPAAVPDSLDDCRTLADCLSLPNDHPDRGDNWLTRVAGFEARDVRQYDTLLAKVRAYNAASDDPMGDDQVQKIAESVWSREQLKKRGASAEVLGAKLRSGELSVAEVVEAWEGFDEKVFNDVAGMYIRDIAKAKYLGHLAALFEHDRDAYDDTPYARMQRFERAAWHRADEQAKILAAPGNTDLGEPDDWDESEVIERDFTGSGLFIQPGWLSLVIGDYESAKTMVFLWTAADRLRRGETVIFIDEESPTDQTFDKLSAFQLTPEQRAGFKRYGHRGWNLAAHPEMLDKLIERHPEATLIGADSVSRLMSNSGLEDDNAGAMRLWTNIEQFVSRNPNVGFYLIDHQGMNGGNHARGASVKVQQSSIAIRLTTKKKFTKSEDGQLTASVLKHRNGLSTGHAFQVDVTTTAPGPLEMHWTDKGASKTEPKSDVPGGDWGPLEFKLMTYIKAAKGEWVSKPELDKASGKDRTTVSRSVAKLIESGRVEEDPDWKAGQSKRYRLAT